MNNIVLYLLKLIDRLTDCLFAEIAYYLLLFSYYQTTEGEKKTSLGTALSPEFTKIVLGCMAAGTVVYVTEYVTDKVEVMVAMSRPGSDEERKALEKAEKFSFRSARGGRDGIFSWPWKKQ